MLKLLKMLGSSCWGDHEWIYRTGERGLWLECRACGQTTAGMNLPPAQYRRTQDADASAHRIGGMPAARQAEVVAAERAKVAPGAARKLTALRGQGTATHASAPATLWVAPIATTDAERRWLQTWRALSPEERATAERMVAQLQTRAVAADVAHAS